MLFHNIEKHREKRFNQVVNLATRQAGVVSKKSCRLLESNLESIALYANSTFKSVYNQHRTEFIIMDMHIHPNETKVLLSKITGTREMSLPGRPACPVGRRRGG